MTNPRNDDAPQTKLENAGRADAFATTHWSVVLDTASADPDKSTAALEILCRQYWQPIHAFVRRRGADRHEAEDLTQAFFAHLLERESVRKADPQKGRFRTFLLGSLTNFLANEWDKRNTLKRGGQFQIQALHEVSEEMFARESSEATTPEKLFDRRWALRLIESVRATLRAEYAASKKTALFEKLEPGLTGELPEGWHANIAAKLGINEGAARVALHRLRRRFGELLREEVSRTVPASADVDGELRHLLAAIAV